MTSFQIPIEQPEEIIPRLGKQELHWKKGRSAYELSKAWMSAGGIPQTIRNVLSQAPDWAEAKMLEGIFERETELGSRGRPSQTDLLAVVSLENENAILGVEGKVDEPFGPRVDDWLAEAKDGNKLARLTALCGTLEVEVHSVGALYYQLFHRTCATIYEAQRFRYSKALMLVHSFSISGTWFPDFQEFSRAVAMPVEHVGSLSAPRRCAGVEMRLGWVSDKPLP